MSSRSYLLKDYRRLDVAFFFSFSLVGRRFERRTNSRRISDIVEWWSIKRDQRRDWKMTKHGLPRNDIHTQVIFTSASFIRPLKW